MNTTKINNAIVQWFTAAHSQELAVNTLAPAYKDDANAVRYAIMDAMRSTKYRSDVLVTKKDNGDVVLTLERNTAGIRKFNRLLAQLREATGGAIQKRTVVELPRGIKTAVKGLLATYTAAQIRAALAELTKK
jgi:hypothetical protein